MTTPPPSSLLLIGCGKMGGALFSRWQKTHPLGIHRFRVVDPVVRQGDSDLVSWFPSLAALPPAYSPSIVVIAVKPQEMDPILEACYVRFQNQYPLYVSIVAGKSLRYMTTRLGGEHAHVVRAMPNSPALIGKAITVMCSSSQVTPAQKKTAENLMNAVGQTVWVEREKEMDAATALSGSGPAYVFLFLESLTAAGIAAGLSEETARRLALATVVGSAELAVQSPDSLSQLRKNVTSPGGTTEAALSVLMHEHDFENLLKRAILKAAGRSKELDNQ